MVTTTEASAPPQTGPGIRASESLLSRHLFAPVDIAPLVFFRISFGLLLMIDLCRYTFSGTVQTNWINPRLHFTYFGFDWVEPLPGNWMYLHVALLFLSALGLTLGFCYRLSAVTFAVGFAWFFLIEQSQYLNHFYFICLLAFIAIFLPAQRALSLDARRHPPLRSDTAPAWTLRILQAQLAIVYFFGGIAKINHDWLRGEPVRTWLHVGGMADRVSDMFRTEFFVYLISYGGLAFDLLVAPFLIWKRTRWLAISAAIVFHLSNAYLFNIGIFPFLSIALTLLFLPPEWIRKLMRLKPWGSPSAIAWTRSRWISALLGLYLSIQILLPLRHWLYPGNVHWTEEGHRYAWHMMLRTKSGSAYFIVEDRRTGKLWKILPQEHLSPRQYSKMATHPEMLLQFAHFIRGQWSHRDIAVHVWSQVTFNGRPSALLIDPEADLSKVQYGPGAAPWILPPENGRFTPGRFRFAQVAPGFPGVPGTLEI